MGIFVIQWGIGLVIDGLQGLGWSSAASFQGAFGLYGCCALAAFLHYRRPSADNRLS
jgi:hypothetical protein